MWVCTQRFTIVQNYFKEGRKDEENYASWISIFIDPVRIGVCPSVWRGEKGSSHVGHDAGDDEGRKNGSGQYGWHGRHDADDEDDGTVQCHDGAVLPNDRVGGDKGKRRPKQVGLQGIVLTVRSRKRVFLSTVICLLILVGAVRLFREKKAAVSVPEDYSKKLGIERPEKVLRAPDFTLEDLSGKRLSLKDLRGKVVFLNFWATWCTPCRQEMPMMEKLHREFKGQGLEVVAINIKENKKEVRKFFDELGLTFISLLDKDGKVSEEYGAWAIPLSYFINRRGEFVGKVEGDRKWDSQEARAFFRELLREKS